jgi:hypothetical protein
VSPSGGRGGDHRNRDQDAEDSENMGEPAKSAEGPPRLSRSALMGCATSRAVMRCHFMANLPDNARHGGPDT